MVYMRLKFVVKTKTLIFAKKIFLVHQNKLHNDKMASHIFVFLYFVRKFFILFIVRLLVVELKRHQNQPLGSTRVVRAAALQVGGQQFESPQKYCESISFLN